MSPQGNEHLELFVTQSLKLHPIRAVFRMGALYSRMCHA